MIKKQVRSIIIFKILIVILFITGCASAEIKKLDTCLLEYVNEKNFSGAILVVRDHKVLVSKGYGYADREKQIPNESNTKFRIGSLTKQFTAMAILILHNRGKLDVKDQIKKYLPDCPSQWEEITIHHLLIHSTGIPDFTVGYEYDEIKNLRLTPDEIIARFKDRRLIFEPGTKWQYSNSNYIVLGKIIEQVSGQSYGSFLQENIFSPLAMTSTGYDDNDSDLAVGYYDTKIADHIDMSILFASGGLYSTVADLYRWDQALFTEKLIPRKLLEEMFTPYIPIPHNYIKDDYYGYGWIIKKEEGNKVILHDGRINGFSSLITRYPDEKSLIVILCNQEHFNCYTIQFEIFKILFDNKEIRQTVQLD